MNLINRIQINVSKRLGIIREKAGKFALIKRKSLPLYDLEPKGFKTIGDIKDTSFNQRVSRQTDHEKELKERFY